MSQPLARPETPLVSLEGLTIRVPAGDEPLLDDVSLSVRRGETLCIVGESGCGKSLTSLAMMGLLAPGLQKGLSGRMVFDGQTIDLRDARALARLRGRRIGMIFQEPMTSLNPLHTIARQLGETLELHQGLKGEAARSRIMDADFAVESANLARTQVLQQAGNAMVAMANQMPQSVLQLLG